MKFDTSLRQLVEENLRRFERHAIDDANLRPAAVALLLLPNEQGEACFVLTRRPLTMRRHPGQFALPGGRVEKGEDPIDAALRELREEVGAAVGRDAVLGLLDDFPTRSGFCMTPIVAWGSRQVGIRPDPAEVAAVFKVPLGDLLEDDIVFEDALDGSEHPVLSLALLDNRVFSPTAALVLQLREVAIRGVHRRVAHYEQPPFAWK